MAPRFAFVPARWLAPDSGLTPADRLTLCVLCQWVNRESGECFPSVPTIAAHAALSENTVRAALKRLVVVGALHVQRRTDANGDPASNLYTILGYDPPRKTAGGGSTIEVPVVQPLQEGGSTDGVEVPQPLKGNVVKENKEVDVAASAPTDPDGSSRPRPYSGPLDRWGNPLPDFSGRGTSPTDEDRAGWRAALRKVGAGPPGGGE